MTLDLDNLPNKLANERRPKTWSDYIGQGGNAGGVADFLKMAIAKDKHPGVIFITGPSGVGKTSIARLYCRATLCPNREPSTFQPCGTCKVCTGDNLDNIAEYTIKEASEFKESIPSIIEYMFSHPHTMDGRKDRYRRFLVVDELQNASRQAISALLDPLEFGPDTTTVILVSMDPDKLDPIVRDAIESRSIPLRLRPLTDEQIAGALVNGTNMALQYEAALALAFFCEGNLRSAWSYVEYFSILGQPFTVEAVYNTFAGGAHDRDRSSMWFALQTGDLQQLIHYFTTWTDAGCNEILLAQVLLHDAIHNLDLDLPLGELCSLIGGWLKTAHKPPLVTVFLSLVSSMQDKLPSSPPSSQPSILPVQDGVSEDFKLMLKNLIEEKSGKTLPIVFPFTEDTWLEIRDKYK